jgi:hypothetical protein
MMDRLLSHLLWLTAMGLIAGTGMVAIFATYAGMFRLFTLDWSRGTAGIGAGLVLGASTYLLCRNGHDLMDR